MILLIDNYDSFVHNLARYLRQLGQQTVVARTDSLTVEQVEQMAPEAIVISPGPCVPSETGISVRIVQHFHRRLPILGICLGHQAIALALGGEIFRTGKPIHGQAREIHHDQRGVFQGLPTPLTAGLYHSLAVEPSSLPAELEISARSQDGTVMGIRHREWPTIGLQFHPESILTPSGFELLRGFLRLTKETIPIAASGFRSELRERTPERQPMPATPVTF
jgi:anthranilate synthase component 2